MKFEKGQIYMNEDMNIYIKGVNNETVRFIEGVSPSAINFMQEIPAKNLEGHINEWGYKRASAEFEAFVNL